MFSRRPSLAAVLTLAPVLTGTVGCFEPATETDDVEYAEASFVLSETADCEAAFDGPYLSQLAADRGWDDADIAGFCAELSDIAETYANNDTLTTFAVAGVGQVDEETLETAYYVGAAGYDLDAIRDWTAAAWGTRAVRRCVRAARLEREESGSLPDGFVTDCLEEETGMPYPEAIFRETRSGLDIDDVGDAGTGLAIALAIYNVPGEGTVVAFLGGAFYAQAEPLYGAFLGCGAAIGFDAEQDEAFGNGVCLAAEYAGS